MIFSATRRVFWALNALRMPLQSAPKPARELTALSRSPNWWGGSSDRCLLTKNPSPAVGLNLLSSPHFQIASAATEASTLGS